MQSIYDRSIADSIRTEYGRTCLSSSRSISGWLPTAEYVCLGMCCVKKERMCYFSLFSVVFRTCQSLEEQVSTLTERLESIKAKEEESDEAERLVPIVPMSTIC